MTNKNFWTGTDVVRNDNADLAQFGGDSEAGRTYAVKYNGITVPSVTTILNNTPASLLEWKLKTAVTAAIDLERDDVKRTKKGTIAAAMRAPDDIADRAADIGNDVHYMAWEFVNEYNQHTADWNEHAINAWIADHNLDGSEEVHNAMRAWAEFVKVMTPFTVQQYEQSFVYTDNFEGFGYGGAVDGLIRSDSGELIALDIKTGRVIDARAALQVAAYAEAFDADRAMIVHCPKWAGAHVLPIEIDIDKAYDVFCDVAVAWERGRVLLSDLVQTN